MTGEQIKLAGVAAATRDEIRFGLALTIREAIDAARAAYGAEAWDEEALTDEVLEMVTGEPS